ncbi:hypothetical protein CYFUS_008642 [Cystobacter fuscus]|uniref:Inclusion body protein n=1 Tax=Cystobacter fuscus TaxID=43 RepID=A0A250JI65_9BACT|nr:AidA/PixA family protein [Cystobacter fuscus]ATB43162.1 hypothetical protein CYFUS_008642 [Cystobacter fuscus]
MANTEQVIDVLVVVDAESIMEQFQGNLSTNPAKPTYIGTNSNLVYMFVKGDEVVSGQATSNLNVAVKTNNLIRWRAASLTMNTEYSVILNSCLITQGQSLISPPQPINPSVYVPVPTVSGGTVTGETRQTFTDFYFQAVGLNTGQVTYTFSFAITNNDGNVLGYFKWDPNLSIS